jgi:hypothetical protein
MQDSHIRSIGQRKLHLASQPRQDFPTLYTVQELLSASFLSYSWNIRPKQSIRPQLPQLRTTEKSLVQEHSIAAIRVRC